MVWNTQSKDIAITEVHGHFSKSPHIVGAALPISTFDFTPMELFGAAALCSHMHYVDPALASPEAEMMARIIERHVDNTSTDFAIMASADGFKDFVKSFFVGTVATGLGYLAMVKAGYDWAAHFEHLAGPMKGKTPDFVFHGEGAGFALMESKGTRSQASKPFNNTVEKGYLKQVEPHLGRSIGGIIPTHGYSIGGWLTSVSKAEVFVHHTEAEVMLAPRARPRSDATLPDDGGAELLQHHDLSTALGIAIDAGLGEDLRLGVVNTVPPVIRFGWLGKTWLARPVAHGFVQVDRSGRKRTLIVTGLGWPRGVFAIEEGNAIGAMRSFGRGRLESRTAIAVEPMTIELMGLAREFGGALFPNGFAVVNPDQVFGQFQWVDWDPKQFTFGV